VPPQVISAIVRAQVKEELRGLRGIRYLRSRCTGDGRYALELVSLPATICGLPKNWSRIA
jgi:hypothetical protein